MPIVPCISPEEASMLLSDRFPVKNTFIEFPPREKCQERDNFETQSLPEYTATDSGGMKSPVRHLDTYHVNHHVSDRIFTCLEHQVGNCNPSVFFYRETGCLKGFACKFCNQCPLVQAERNLARSWQSRIKNSRISLDRLSQDDQEVTPSCEKTSSTTPSNGPLEDRSSGGDDKYSQPTTSTQATVPPETPQKTNTKRRCVYGHVNAKHQVGSNTENKRNEENKRSGKYERMEEEVIIHPANLGKKHKSFHQCVMDAEPMKKRTSDECDFL